MVFGATDGGVPLGLDGSALIDRRSLRLCSRQVRRPRCPNPAILDVYLQDKPEGLAGSSAGPEIQRASNKSCYPHPRTH